MQSFAYSLLSKAAQIINTNDTTLLTQYLGEGRRYADELTSIEALLYTAPADLVDYPSDVSVMVRARNTNRVVMG